MKKFFDKIIKFDVYGLGRSILVFLAITILVISILNNMTYKQTKDAYIDLLVNQADDAASQFDDTILSNMEYLSVIANVMREYDSLKSQSAISTMRAVLENGHYTNVSVVYSNGDTIDAHGIQKKADIDILSEVYENTSGVSVTTVDAGDTEAIIYVPIVTGSSALVGQININYFNKWFVGDSEKNVVKVRLFDAFAGQIIFDLNSMGTQGNSVGKNLHELLKDNVFQRGYSYTNLITDIRKGVGGKTSYYSDEDKQFCYAAYSPLEYGDWYLMLEITESTIKGVADNSASSTILVLLCLVLVYLLIMLFSAYLIRKSNKENELIRMKVQVAELANEAKTKFLSNMSHDIRTPLNAIVGLSDICEMNADDPERVKDCIAKQRAASEHLMTLINDVLEMSRIESGKVIFDDDEFNLGKQLHELVVMIQQRIVEKNLNFKLRLQNLVHENVIGDEQRLNRVIINIVSNAVKFTGDGGSISISLNENPTDREGYSEYELTIADTGIGMSSDFLKRIFVPFERMQDSTVSQIEGAGLGMTIAKELIEKMGGKIEVQSGVGVGTTVTIRLVMKYVESENETKLTAKIVDKYKDGIVVVVDDDPILIDWMKKLFDTIGIKCIATEEPEEALETVESLYKNPGDITVMILGWKMPKMNGIDLAIKMRELVGNDVPIVLQTAYEISSSDRAVRTAGINSIYLEPMTKSDIIDMLSDIGDGDITNKVAFPDFSGKKILLVEDHRVNAEIVAEYLQYTGIQVDIVYDGVEAIDRINSAGEYYYDLILMDIRMPKMNGYDATREIRKMGTKYAKDIPIIALSANAFVEDRRMSKEVGMNGHLAKPVKYNEVYAELKKWFVYH